MTGADLFQGTRVILRDTGYGTYSDGRAYAPAEIASALTAARMDSLGYLYGAFAIIGGVPNFAGYNAQMAGGGLPPVRARVTTTKLLHTVNFTIAGQAVPDDFWKIECGVASGPKYIHAEPPKLGQALGTNSFQSQVYTQGGKFYGTPCQVYYWAVCTTPIADDGTDLRSGAYGLPDGFYHAVKYLACANLIKKERAENKERFELLMNTFMRRLASLN